MMKIRHWIFCLFLILNNGFLVAQNQVVPLWPEGAPGAIADSTYIETLDTDKPWRIRNVSDPTLSVYLAPSAKAAGTAVVICPGGGYQRLAFDHEGFQVAEWLTTLGIAGIVLKYRLPDDRIMKDKSIGPLQDVQQAIRIVRRHAKEWGVDPHKIGVMGFSAGGHLAATASTLYNVKVYDPTDTVSARPDFSVLIYPVISMTEAITHAGSRSRLLGDNPDSSLVPRLSNELQVSPLTPPAFMVHSADDGTVPVQNSIDYFLAMQKNRVPCELHLYEKGGHGYGLGRESGTEKAWPEAVENWLRFRGLR